MHTRHAHAAARGRVAPCVGCSITLPSNAKQCDGRCHDQPNTRHESGCVLTAWPLRRDRASAITKAACNSVELSIQQVYTPALQLADWVNNTLDYRTLTSQFQNRVAPWWPMVRHSRQHSKLSDMVDCNHNMPCHNRETKVMKVTVQGRAIHAGCTLCWEHSVIMQTRLHCLYKGGKSAMLAICIVPMSCAHADKGRSDLHGHGSVWAYRCPVPTKCDFKRTDGTL